MFNFANKHLTLQPDTHGDSKTLQILPKSFYIPKDKMFQTNGGGHLWM